MTDFLVQTRLPKSLETIILQLASLEGDTVAAWVRRLILRELNPPRVGAFVKARMHADPRVVLNQGEDPQVYLVALREVSATERVFSLFHGHGSGGAVGSPMGERAFLQLPAFTRTAEHQMILRGSPNRWEIVAAIFEERAQRVEITLRALPPDPVS